MAGVRQHHHRRRRHQRRPQQARLPPGGAERARRPGPGGVPAHTRVDGDAFVAAAIGAVDADVDVVRGLAVHVVARAIASLAGEGGRPTAVGDLGACRPRRPCAVTERSEVQKQQWPYATKWRASHRSARTVGDAARATRRPHRIGRGDARLAAAVAALARARRPRAAGRRPRRRQDRVHPGLRPGAGRDRADHQPHVHARPAVRGPPRRPPPRRVPARPAGRGGRPRAVRAARRRGASC